MMNWASAVNTVGAQDNRFQVGEYNAAFVVLTFDSTAVGAIADGRTYDPVNYLTTKPGASNVPGSNLIDVAGIRQIVQVICPDSSSSANARLAGASTFTGTVKIVWDETKQAFRLFLVGNASTSGGVDPTVRTDDVELDGTSATAMAGLNFRMIVIGR
jgi:hypothetical protein